MMFLTVDSTIPTPYGRPVRSDLEGRALYVVEILTAGDETIAIVELDARSGALGVVAVKGDRCSESLHRCETHADAHRIVAAL